jgi:UDP-N-acetylglucosamine diphosphorylase/glucosamine-1-phosphate N-acetyltransferase
MHILVFEDSGVTHLVPLAQTRPAFGLWCGAASLLERQRRCFDADALSVLVRPELAGPCHFLLPGVPVNTTAAGQPPQVLVNGRWLAPESVAVESGGPCVGLVGDQVAFVVLPSTANPAVAQATGNGPPVPCAPTWSATGVGLHLWFQNLTWYLDHWKAHLPTRPAGGAMIDYPWDLVQNNAHVLEQDERFWRTHREAIELRGPSLVGPPERLLVDSTARVEPLVLIDTTKGPVMVDRDAVVEAFSRLEGPCYVGPGTHVLAGRVRGSSFGPHCRIGGEVESSIVHGYSNKAHEGFLGHSYVGEWVNLGSGTQTSDLRNDYGQVTVTIAGQKVDTGLLKVGSFIGDHTKTSISCLLNTGSVVGPFGMLVNSGGLLPRTLPAFCLFSEGRLRERTDLGTMFTTAATMMARRDTAWLPGHADFYFDLYERTSGERTRLLRDSEQRSRRVPGEVVSVDFVGANPQQKLGLVPHGLDMARVGPY